MKTTTHLALFLLTTACAAHIFAGDAKVTLDSTDGSSAFLVRDSASNELARVQSDGKIGIGIAAPAYTLDVLGDINLTGLFYTNGVAWNPLTSFTETDPVFAASTAAGIDAAKVSNWNAAYGWGNHATAGYLTAYTETDPVFAVSVAAGITTDSTNAWNAKVSGSGTEGYLSKFTASGTVGDSALFSDADGNIGIGTPTPASKFQVYGTETGANWAGRGVFGGASNSVVLGQYNNKAYFGAHNGTLDGWSDLTINPGGGNVLLANGGGNVGIGTETPAYKLDVVGSFNATGITIGGVPVASSTDTYWSTNASAAGSIQYSGGNVGIGTTTPYTTLTVGSTDATAKITAGGPNTHLTLASAGPAGSIYLNAGGVESGHYSTSTRLTILPEGRVGIGTTTPADLLQVGNLMFGGNSGRDISSTSGYDINYKATGASSHHFYANGTEIFTIDKTGNIGIGINTPAYTLHVNGSVAGTSAYNNLSDARLKKDVLPINDALAIVEQLRGVTFNWDQTVDPAMKLDDRNHVGFLAQEVEAVLPQAVSTASDARQTKSVAYSEVIPVLVEAMKQQQAQIDALKAEVEALKIK